MLASQERNMNKSPRRIRIKSPLDFKHKISLEQNSREKISTRKSNGSTSDSNESEKNAFPRFNDSHQNGKIMGKNWTSTQGFKNKIYVSSCQFNKLKQKLQSNQGASKNNVVLHNKKPNEKKIRIKILDTLSKQASNKSERSNTVDNSTGSSDSETIELLKVENQYFKKIYDQALGQLSKLKNKLKQEKKVHDVQKQIYQNQINKLKRIVDSEKEEVSHIICDEENRYIIVVSTIEKNRDDQDGILGLDSDMEDNQSSISNLSILSK